MGIEDFGSQVYGFLGIYAVPLLMVKSLLLWVPPRGLQFCQLEPLVLRSDPDVEMPASMTRVSSQDIPVRFRSVLLGRLHNPRIYNTYYFHMDKCCSLLLAEC